MTYVTHRPVDNHPPAPRSGLSTVLMATVGIMAVTAFAAGAQSASPFASKKKKQAWESSAPASAPSTTTQSSRYQAPRVAVPPSYQDQAPTLSPGTTSNYSGPSYTAPSYTAPSYTAPSYRPPSAAASPQPSAERYGTYAAQPAPPSAPASQSFTQPAAPVYSNSDYNTQGQYGYPQQDYAPTMPVQSDGNYYPGRPKQAQPLTQVQSSRHAQNYGQYGAQQSSNAYSGPMAQNANRRPSYGPENWKSKLGLGNLATTLSGFFKAGVAGTFFDNESDDGFREDFVAVGEVRGEVSAITQGGLEYGIGGKIRAQYDKYRRGFGGRVGDCPPDISGCPSVDIAGTPTAVRGHTSGFYAAGADNAKDFEVGLEGAYLFLRSAYGDITVGRDDGAAYLFSLGAPKLTAVNASNSPVDYTGLDSVKTINDASGFSEKIAYVSPRLLGDQIGVGVQIGASYAPNARACGVDYCVRGSGRDGSGVLEPDLDDVLEFGLSLDRKFDNGLSVEATASYATASEQSALAAFDDLQSFGAGLELALKGWRLGGSYLNSNNALQDGDYTAYDIGLSYKPGRWGASLSYGHATDDNVGLSADQATLGFVYDINSRFTLGTGVQYVDRRVPGISTANGVTVLTRNKERAASVFVEGGVTF